MLSEMAGEKSDIEDPYGGPYSGYEQAAEDIQVISGEWIRYHYPACISSQLKNTLYIEI